MDRFEAMTVFVAVTDAHGFAAAARKLNMSPAAVTRHIAALEDQLGLRLLQRTTRRLKLTDAGKRYIESVRRILSEVERADAAAQAEQLEPSGRLCITAPPVFGRLHIAPLLSQFLLRWPRVQGELLLTDQVVDLIGAGVDLAVRIGRLRDSSLVSRKIGTQRRVYVASPKYLHGRKRPHTLADLSQHACVQLSVVEGPALPGVRLVTNSPDAALTHLLRGGGIGLALGYQVADAVTAGRLEILLSTHEPAPAPIQLVYPSSRQLSANVRAFIDMVEGTKRDWVL
jgi:DNA-binding transcriptional LysR family regulator